MIGIVTRYRKHDSTFIALSLARYLDAVGYKYMLIRYDWRVGAVDPEYDSRVFKRAFRQWLSKVSHIVWTAPVDDYFLYEAKKQGIRSTLYTSWDQLEPYDEFVLGSFSQVLVPTVIQAMQIRDRFKLRNVAVLPYYCGLPVTRKSSNVSTEYTSLYLSLYGNQLRCVDLSAIFLLADIVKDNPKVKVTIAACKGLAPMTIRNLKRFSKKLGNRWNVLFNCPWNQQVIEMGKHDLTVWPARWDGIGLVGSTSLHMGTPVIAWDITPTSEHLSTGRNSLLVACDVEYNWLGVSKVIPDYDEFDRVLRWLLGQPDALAELRQHTHERLEDRKTEFKKGWNTLLPLSV